MPNQGLAAELHKPIITKFKKWKVYSLFKDNIWDADLSDIQLISKFNINFFNCFLLRVIDIFHKCTWVIPLKDKKSISINNTFRKILDESNRKRTKYG